MARQGPTLPLQRGLKRALDVAVALGGLVVLGPVMAAVAATILARMGRPVLFRQVRPGLHAQPFTLLKFRTMRSDVDRHGQPLADEERLTTLGRFLRRWSLDELPQLFNVLRGDISLVGPRPLLIEYLSRYTPEQARRHEVRPGITGWAQVNGRNAIGWEEKFAYDLWYIDHWSLWLDLRILWRTLVQILKGHGISSGDTATMPRFLGRDAEIGSVAAAAPDDGDS